MFPLNYRRIAGQAAAIQWITFSPTYGHYDDWWTLEMLPLLPAVAETSRMHASGSERHTHVPQQDGWRVGAQQMKRFLAGESSVENESARKVSVLSSAYANRNELQFGY